MILPGVDESRKLSERYSVVPVYAQMLADTETPVSVWLKLFGSAQYSFLLESVTGGESVARYSFIGGDPFMTFKGRGNAWELSGICTEKGNGNPVDKLRQLFTRYQAAPVDGLPRFTGGAVGYCSYDSVRLWENIPDNNPAPFEQDDLFFGFYRDLVVFDNREHRLLIVSNIIVSEHDTFDAGYVEACHRIGRLMDRMGVQLFSMPIAVKQLGDIRSNMERVTYEHAVKRAKEYIKAGDIFQVVLSQRFSVGVETEPFNLYRILRTVNPSPYMFYLALGDRSVIGASPEMLVRVEDGAVEVRPIAGTRRRGKDGPEDESLEKDLLADHKELAEHVMLVDLGRNDVGRVSRFGTVHVEEMMHIERFSHVMHIVSKVKGELASGKDAFDALGSCFPAGTLSGAPKIRAMEIIDELEVSRRGLYGGALGYIDFSGNMDTCIVIRTILYENKTAHIQVGAGIVADSVPAREYEETVHKASALFAAIGDAGRVIGG